MLFSDRNPRIYDKTSRFINTPMISLTLRDINQGELHVQELPMPVIIKIPTGSKYKYYTEYLTNDKKLVACFWIHMNIRRMM